MTWPAPASRFAIAVPEGQMADGCELVVCTTCRLPGHGAGEVPGADPLAPRDGARLSAALKAQGIAHRAQECLSACANGCVVVFRGSARWTYVQGRLDPDQHLDELIAMYRAFVEAPDGIVPWRARPEVIRKNTLARIPPMEL